MPTYRMTQPGGCKGAKTGRSYTFDEGQEIDAPEGEFEHLHDDATRVVDYQDRQMTAKSGPRYQLRKVGGGWHKVLDTETGEYVEGESSRDAEQAQANADRLNENA